MSKSPSKTMKIWKRNSTKTMDKQIALFNPVNVSSGSTSFYSESEEHALPNLHVNDMFSNAPSQLNPDNIRVHMTMRIDTTHEEDHTHLLAMLETWIDDYTGISCNYPLLTSLFAMASAGSVRETPRRWTYCRDLFLQVRTESTLKTLGPLTHNWVRHTGMGVHRINIELTINVSNTKRSGRLISQEIVCSGLAQKTMCFLEKLGVSMTLDGDIVKTN